MITFNKYIYIGPKDLVNNDGPIPGATYTLYNFTIHGEVYSKELLRPYPDKYFIKLRGLTKKELKWVKLIYG